MQLAPCRRAAAGLLRRAAELGAGAVPNDQCAAAQQQVWLVWVGLGQGLRAGGRVDCPQLLAFGCPPGGSWLTALPPWCRMRPRAKPPAACLTGVALPAWLAPGLQLEHGRRGPLLLGLSSCPAAHAPVYPSDLPCALQLEHGRRGAFLAGLCRRSAERGHEPAELRGGGQVGAASCAIGQPRS